MMNEPQVSFITVCYNGFKDTCELIESLQTHVHSVSYEMLRAKTKRLKSRRYIQI